MKSEEDWRYSMGVFIGFMAIWHGLTLLVMLFVYMCDEEMHEMIEDFNKFGKFVTYTLLWQAYAWLFVISFIQTAFTYKQGEYPNETFGSTLKENYYNK